MRRLLVRWLLHYAGWLVVIVGVVCLAVAAFAQEPKQPGHMQYHDAYQGWCLPGHGPNCSRGLSCCDARVVTWKADGTPETILGHCYPTEFRPNPTGRTDWIAKLSREDAILFKQEWVEVPNGKIIREKNPDKTGISGHICTDAHSPTIRCGVPPTGAM